MSAAIKAWSSRLGWLRSGNVVYRCVRDSLGLTDYPGGLRGSTRRRAGGCRRSHPTVGRTFIGDCICVALQFQFLAYRDRVSSLIFHMGWSSSRCHSSTGVLKRENEFANFLQLNAQRERARPGKPGPNWEVTEPVTYCTPPEIFFSRGWGAKNFLKTSKRKNYFFKMVQFITKIGRG